MNKNNLPLSFLKKHFGYDAFRPLQSEIVTAITEKNDTLVIMPTGGGKSLCFQLPALLMEGTCIVLSPLIALMRDQVESLRENGISAAYINSSQSFEEQQEIMTALHKGEIKLLYVSPEKLLSQGFISTLKTANINLLAIDEAHCISMWGHDFRPEYTRLRELRKSFPGVPTVALTATADRATQDDICTQLAMNTPVRFVSSFDRPNISLSVLPGKKRFEAIYDFIKQHQGQSGIIYCLSRNSTEKLAQKLRDKKINASCYHAGLSNDERSNIQDDFLSDRTEIICATIAFGMGIDKSNIRWVIHYNLPKNMEGYYQEIGRAGRDGLPAEALLFYSYADVVQLKNFIENSNQQEILTAKLDRMQDYADAVTCRRKILLSYFNEHMEHNCKNCDVCNNPPVTFDGTILVQKALSALARIKEPLPAQILIDVLRGSHRQEIIERGLHTIKTWGAGADISFEDWRHYILQMLHQGLLELYYRNNQGLYLSHAGGEVLFNNKKIQLVKPADLIKFKEQKESRPSFIGKLEVDIKCLEHLKILRKSIADERSVPAYIIFSDAALNEMAAVKPITDSQFLGISGVGQKKLAQYGDQFIHAILDYTLNQKSHT